MILVTRDQTVHNRVITLDQPISSDQLASIRNYVNHNFSGWQLGAARRELVRRMLEERALYDQVLLNVQLLYQKGLLDVDLSPEIHLEGVSNLLGLDLHLNREKLRDLMRALEEKKRLIELLDEFLDQPAGELEIHVGLERAHPAMKDLALIGMTVRLGTGLPAKVAVLGPMRMNYERVMSAVLETSQALQRAPF
jgi:heat-inducible transcriptional repressor